MILIDLYKKIHKVIVTVSGGASEIPSFQLLLKSTFTKKDFIIPLGNNLSEYTERYDEFDLNLGENIIEVGEYTYQILDKNKILEIGYAKIINSEIVEENEVTIYISDTAEDTFFTYNG